VEQLGAGGVATVAPDESALILKLTMPESIQEEAFQKLPANMQKRYVPVLYELHVGPRPTVP